MKQKSVVAIFTSTEGHLSLAEAAKEVFDHDDAFDTVVFQEIDSLFPLYIFLYQFFPNASGFFFKKSQDPIWMKRLRRFLQKRHETKLRTFFEQHKPDLMINTYFMYIPTLEELAAEYQVPLINVLPDPKTIHPLLVSPLANMNLAFDEHEVATVKKLFAHQSINVEAAGWLLRERFNHHYDQAKLKQELGLDPNTFTLLLSSGSDGTNHVLKIVPSLLKVKTPLHIIVACGHNQTLLTGVTALQKLWIDQKSPHHLVAITFTPEIHRYVQAADLIVGKAGPNSVFETSACHKPFFAITHISGQEDGNLDIINDYHLGYVEEEPKQAAELLQKLIEDPTQLSKLMPSIKKMAEHNQHARTRLLQLGRSLIKS